MSHQFKIHIFHVSGEIMIKKGADGLSRGNFYEGNMKGRNIFEFIPVNNNALEISPFLEEWLKYWVGEYAEILEPGGWFISVHDLDKVPGVKETNVEGHWIPYYCSGKIIWTPAPAAAFTAIVELQKSRQKRQHSTNMFIVPRLVTPFWRKHLLKAANIVLELKLGHPPLPVDMLETLKIAVCYPYLSHIPW